MTKNLRAKTAGKFARNDKTGFAIKKWIRK